MTEPTPDRRTFHFTELATTRATAKGHGLVAGDLLVFFGRRSCDQFGRVCVVREAGPILLVERASDGVEVTSFGRAAKFWAAPVPVEPTSCASCTRPATHTVTLDVEGKGLVHEPCCAGCLFRYAPGSTFPTIPAHEGIPEFDLPPYPVTPGFRVVSVEPTEESSRRVEQEEISTEIRTFLDGAQARANRAAAPTESVDLAFPSAALFEQWLAWRAEWHYRVHGADRRLSRTLAAIDWTEFAPELDALLSAGRAIRAIVVLRGRTRDPQTGQMLSIRDARDWVYAYRAAPPWRILRALDDTGAEVIDKTIVSSQPVGLLQMSDVEAFLAEARRECARRAERLTVQGQRSGESSWRTVTVLAPSGLAVI